MAGYRTVQLTWNVLPDTAFNRDVTFTSSDEAIATVNEMGQVTGVSQGEATITVTTKDGGFTDTCLVTVTPDEPPVNLSLIHISIILAFVRCIYRNLIVGDIHGHI